MKFAVVLIFLLAAQAVITITPEICSKITVDLPVILIII